MGHEVLQIMRLVRVTGAEAAINDMFVREDNLCELDETYRCILPVTQEKPFQVKQDWRSEH